MTDQPHQPPKPGEPMRMACVGCGRDVPDASARCVCGSWHYRWEHANARRARGEPSA
jgi:hypothetical protein